MVRIKQTARKTANVPMKGWKLALIISKAKKETDFLSLNAAEVDQPPAAAKKLSLKRERKTKVGAKTDDRQMVAEIAKIQDQLHQME